MQQTIRKHRRKKRKKKGEKPKVNKGECLILGSLVSLQGAHDRDLTSKSSNYKLEIKCE